MAAAIGALILAGINFIVGGISGVSEHEANIDRAEKYEADLRQKIKDAQAIYDQQVRHATESHATAVAAAEAGYRENRAVGHATQQSSEEQAVNAIFDTVVAGGRAAGSTEASLASSSGVRKEGSVERTIGAVEEEFDTRVERQEDRLEDQQDMFDLKWGQSFDQERRTIEGYDEQLRQITEQLTLGHDQLADQLWGEVWDTGSQIYEMNKFESYAGAFFGAADFGSFSNALGNIDLGGGADTTVDPVPLSRADWNPPDDFWAGG